MDKLGLEIAQIALPAALALTADPIASLVDMAFIGQIGIPYTLLRYSLFFIMLFHYEQVIIIM